MKNEPAGVQRKWIKCEHVAIGEAKDEKLKKIRSEAELASDTSAGKKYLWIKRMIIIYCFKKLKKEILAIYLRAYQPKIEFNHKKNCQSSWKYKRKINKNWMKAVPSEQSSDWADHTETNNDLTDKNKLAD